MLQTMRTVKFCSGSITLDNRMLQNTKSFEDFGIPIQDMFNYITNYDSFLTDLLISHYQWQNSHNCFQH